MTGVERRAFQAAMTLKYCQGNVRLGESKYNPLERCRGILDQHGNGTKLETVETMRAWAKSMPWKGIQPVVNLSKTAYQIGISLSKVTMQAIEARLERNPILPKWDILIRPG